MRKLLLLLALHASAAFCQETVIGNKDNVEISYQLTELEKGAKKDRYLLTVSFQNKGDADLYYALPLTKNDKGTESISFMVPKGFAEIKVRNATGILGAGSQLMGQETILRTEDNAVLMALEKGKIYNVEDEFNVKSGEKPIVTNSYKHTLRTLDAFNLKMNDAFLSGIWKSSCGNSTISLSLIDENGQQKLLQNVNGIQIKWIKQSPTTFLKENDVNSTLTYNKSNNRFYYSSSDGNNCEWVKS